MNRMDGGGHRVAGAWGGDQDTREEASTVSGRVNGGSEGDGSGGGEQVLDPGLVVVLGRAAWSRWSPGSVGAGPGLSPLRGAVRVPTGASFLLFKLSRPRRTGGAVSDMKTRLCNRNKYLTQMVMCMLHFLFCSI